MAELFQVQLHPDSDGFDMQMNTGTITVPDNPGCCVVSSGCGSGKTESIKNLIRQTYNEGILYCVDTRVELEKMYQWIIDNLCSPFSDLTENDVLILSSDDSYRDFLEEYWDEPELLLTKKVILLTHTRFFSDLINYFLIYRPASFDIPIFDGDFGSLLQREDLRRYIIFDETPTFIKPFFSMPRSLLGAFSTLGNEGWRCRDLQEIADIYHTFIRPSSDNPFPKSSNKLSRIKTSVVFQVLQRRYLQWLADKSGNIEITFTPANLCCSSIKNHILIFEGAGDILFSGSPLFKLLDIPNKYNANVVFEQFPFELKRRKENSETHFREFAFGLRKALRDNQQAGKKSLVVVWKSMGEGAGIEDFGFYNAVLEYLKHDSRLRVTSYSVIYFGSSEMKSTNIYRDYSDIFLCGTWNIPNSETSKFQQCFGAICSNRNHLLWAYVQLLCRIGIRKHDGQTYTVHYSSDYSQPFIDQLSRYFNQNQLVRPNIVEVSRIPDWLEEKIQSTSIGAKKRFLENLSILIEHFPDLLTALKTNQGYSLSISLDALYSLIPKDRRKADRYKNFRNNLQKIGVELIIL